MGNANASIAPSRARRGMRFVDRWLPPALFVEDETKLRQARTAIGFLCASWLMAFVFAVANFRQGNSAAGFCEVFAVLVLSATLPMIRRTGRYVLWGNIGMSTGMGSIFLACWYADGLEGPALLMIPLVPVWSFLGYGRRSALLWTCVSALLVVFLYASERLGKVPAPSASFEKIQGKRFIEALLSIGFGFLATRIFDDIKDYALNLLREEREKLAGANAHLSELFHNMRQGVLAFGADGRVVGSASKQAHTIFGVRDLSGADVTGLLYDAALDPLNERDAFDAWRQMAFETRDDEWESMASFAPERVVHRLDDGSQRHLLLEFRPIAVQNGRISRLMLLVTDETERIRMRDEAAKRDAAYKRQAELLRRVAAGGAHLVLDFLKGSERRLETVTELLATPVCDQGAMYVAFQRIHTIKGEARCFQLQELEEACHALEERLSGLVVHRELDAAVRTELAERTEAVRAELARARDRLIAASPVGEAVLDQITVRRSDVERLVEVAAARGERALSDVADRLASRPFGESAQQLSESVQAWASKLEKQVRFEVHGRETPVEPGLAGVLGGVLAQLARNAVAHGIESPVARVAAGKPAQGTLRISCERRGQGLEVRVADDGAGVDEAAARARASALGHDGAERALLDVLSTPGVSTADAQTVIAGRGVGLGAAREELAHWGYALALDNQPGRGAQFRIVLARALVASPDNENASAARQRSAR